PSIHIQFHRCKGLPLKVAGIDLRILSSENTIHIRSDIRLSRQTRTNIGRNMESYIFPLSTGLISRPDTSIALCASPAIQRNNKWSGIIAVIRHDMTYIGYPIQPEGITRSDPSNICFQDPNTSIPNLLHDISLQQGIDTILRMKV